MADRKDQRARPTGLRGVLALAIVGLIAAACSGGDSEESTPSTAGPPATARDIAGVALTEEEIGHLGVAIERDAQMDEGFTACMVDLVVEAVGAGELEPNDVRDYVQGSGAAGPAASFVHDPGRVAGCIEVEPQSSGEPVGPTGPETVPDNVVE